jgi:hypothetical protein
VATKADTVTLLLLNAASRDYTQAERQALRAEVLAELGLTEDEAASQVASAHAAAEKAADKAAAPDADPEPADTGTVKAKG